MISTKCPKCGKGSGYTTCCGHDKETGESVETNSWSGFIVLVFLALIAMGCAFLGK